MQVAQLLLYFLDDLHRAVHPQLYQQDDFMYNKNRKKEGVHLSPPQRQSCQPWASDTTVFTEAADVDDAAAPSVVIVVPVMSL